MDAFNDILNEPLSQDTEQLKQFVAKAREAETKTKMQIYTIRGQKGLAALKHSYVPDEDEPQPDIYDIEKSPQIIELRRQIELMKEMEQAQLDEIERLKREKAIREAQPSLRESFTTGIIENPQFQIEQARELHIESSVAEYHEMEVAMPVSITVPQFVSQAAPVPVTIVSAPIIPNIQPVEIAQPPPGLPSHSQSMGDMISPRNMLSNAFNSTSSGSTPNINPQAGSAIRNKKGKAKMPAPQAVVMRVLNASWDTGSSKSKKNNKVFLLFFLIFQFLFIPEKIKKVYTIQVTINQTTWKIIRGDDALVELSKKVILHFFLST